MSGFINFWDEVLLNTAHIVRAFRWTDSSDNPASRREPHRLTIEYTNGTCTIFKFGSEHDRDELQRILTARVCAYEISKEGSSLTQLGEER